MNRKSKRKMASGGTTTARFGPPKGVDPREQLAVAWQAIEAGKRNEARRIITKVITARPNLAVAHFCQAHFYKTGGQHKRAIASYRKVIELEPDDHQAWHNLGNALRETGDMEGAFQAYNGALKLRPDDLAVRENIAGVHFDRTEFAAAQALYIDGLKYAPNSLNMHFGAGMSLYQIGDPAQALPHFLAALELTKDAGILAEINHMAGVIYGELSELSRARQHYARALVLAPEIVKTQIKLARLEEKDTDWLKKFEQMLGQSKRPQSDTAELHYASGDLHDRQGNQKPAFEHYQAANRIRSATYKGTQTVDGDWVKRLIAAFSPDLMRAAQDKGLASEKPVFIVGMPRSGKTSVQKVISTHDGIFNAGENTFFSRTVDRLISDRNLPPYPEGVGQLTSDQLEQIGARCLTELETLARGEQRLVSALPGDYLRLGIIAMALPQVKIIHCRRNPMDTCIENYFKDFGPKGYIYSTDLEKLGLHCRQYHQIMAHWREALPGGILDVDFEALIEQPDEQRRRIIKFCGLKPDDRETIYFSDQAADRKSEVWPVSKDTVKAAIDCWQPYERHLDPLKQALGDLAETT